MRTKCPFAAMLAALACVIAPPALAASFTLSTPDPDNSSITVAARNFADLVKKETNGEVEIKVFPNGTLYGGDPGAAVKQLGGGSLDLLLLSASLYANFKPRFIAVSIPYLFDNMDQFKAYLASDAARQLDADVASMNIQPLGYWPRPFRVITNSKVLIKSPADLKGIKLRVPNNPLWVEFFRAMDAAPTPMAFGEVYNALQLAVVDGQENPISIPMDAKFYEVQKYLTFTNHIADAWVLGMNRRKWDALPENVKAAVGKCAVQAQFDKIKYDEDGSGSTEAFLKEKGMETYRLTPGEHAQFVGVAKKLYPRFGELVKDDAFYKKTLEFVGKN
ncbi:MAG: DctP family TRAP transporter solute-binding subunit [Planctomycetota bacterium]|jgi:tripartite ATP-independent transporter DctP family solute receptor|nr:DctP family TRAP transporter solute-binding subunit [Planctomycetota bacterium]